MSFIKPASSEDRERRRISIASAWVMAGSKVGDIVPFGQEIARSISAKVDAVIAENGKGHDKGAMHLLRQKGAVALAFLRDQASKRSFIKETDPEQAPSLLDNPQEDRILKVQILGHLQTEISASSTLYDNIAGIVQRCFDRGIAADRLIKFFEDPNVLAGMINSATHAHLSILHGPTAVELIGSTAELIANKIARVGQNMKKDPLDTNQVEQCEELFAQFCKNYDPLDSKTGIDTFISELRTIFKDYLIVDWIDEKNPNFVELLNKGKNGKQSLVSLMVNRAYARKGSLNPEGFIAHHIPRIMKIEGGHIFLDIEYLVDFFENKLSDITTDSNSPKELRKIIIDLCLKRIRSINDESMKISLLYRDDEEDQVIASKDGWAVVRESIIRKTIYLYTRRPDDQNRILIDPEFTPPVIEEKYEEWFTRTGKLARQGKPYERYIRSMYSVNGYNEEIGVVKARVRKWAMYVNKYLRLRAQEAGVPVEAVIASARVEACDDLGELVKIAHTSSIPEEVFAATRKWEMIIKVFYELNARVVFAEGDALLAQERSASMAEHELGFKVKSGEPLYVYSNHKSEGAEIIIRDEPDLVTTTIDIHQYLEAPALADTEALERDWTQVLTAETVSSQQLQESSERLTHLCTVVEASIFGVEGFLIISEEELEEDQDPTWMHSKSLNSIIGKRIRKQYESLAAMKDIGRMTFIVKNPDDMEIIRKVFPANKYVEESKDYLTGENGGKATVNGKTSGAYNGLNVVKYVVREPVMTTEGQLFHIKTEQRYGTIDLLNEKAKDHPISHALYKVRTSRDEIRVLCPPSIKQFADTLYKNGKKGKVLKTKEDFATDKEATSLLLRTR
ncbi:hypothetical protein JKY72_03425 [Candidatus Gracilibacteria bacterium]|nr:hypothetical protein [Candidatus Gracilibacteria bacterium]